MSSTTPKSWGRILASSIIIENVDAAYGSVRVLEHVSVSARPGETVVLLGTNGNGKSTLMKCIMGMVKPESGSIQLSMDGVSHDLTQLSTEEIVNLGVALVPEGRGLVSLAGQLNGLTTLPDRAPAQGYDTALLIDAAIRAVKGKVEDRDAVMKALKSVKAKSVRGPYRINNNGYPVQNYYLRVIGKDAQGRIVNKTMGTVFTNHADAYARECALK